MNNHDALYIGMTENLLFSHNKYERIDMSFLSRISSLDYGNKHRVLLIGFSELVSADKYIVIQQQLRKTFDIYLTTVCDNLLMCILPEKMVDIKKIKQLYDYLTDNYCSIKLSASTVKNRLEDSNIGLQEATRTYDMIDSLKKGNENILLYEELGIYGLLYDLKDVEVIEFFYNSIFSSVWIFDKENDAHLFETLEKYFRNNCDKAKTSADLYIHENTLRYRLQQIEKVMNCDLKDVNTITDIVTALKVRRMIQILEDS